MKLFTASLATLLACLSVTTQAEPTHQFDHFFPGWNPVVQTILHDNCSEPYANYLTGHVNYTLGKESLVNPVIDCVLQQFPESRKAELGTASLVLGLIPTILQTIGSSTAETALVGLRRPILGFLLSAGSPTVGMIKTRDFTSAIDDFIRGGDLNDLGISILRRSQGRARWAFLISVLEYIIVGGAVANVLHLAWNLGIYAVAIFAPNTVFGVPLWTLGAALIYLGARVALWIRVRTSPLDARHEDEYSAHEKPLDTWLPSEFIPAAFQSAVTVEIRSSTASKFWFQAWAWAVSIGILAQVAFGTLVLSGLLFFSLADCLIIVARYTLSALACRAVVRVELAGMMSAVVPAPAPRKGMNEAVEAEQIALTGWKGHVQEA
ncbi:hypothetical protein F4777DRAFT_563437 [Nemania sp. FL0916]|nr:hypothetical protein F4777DRAFT_563437 [Nemania sp. FL0916]